MHPNAVLKDWSDRVGSLSSIQVSSEESNVSTRPLEIKAPKKPQKQTSPGTLLGTCTTWENWACQIQLLSTSPNLGTCARSMSATRESINNIKLIYQIYQSLMFLESKSSLDSKGGRQPCSPNATACWVCWSCTQQMRRFGNIPSGLKCGNALNPLQQCLGKKKLQKRTGATKLKWQFHRIVICGWQVHLRWPKKITFAD